MFHTRGLTGATVVLDAAVARGAGVLGAELLSAAVMHWLAIAAFEWETCSGRHGSTLSIGKLTYVCSVYMSSSGDVLMACFSYLAALSHPSVQRTHCYLS